MSLKAKLEAVIYAAEEPVTLAQLAALFADEALEWKAEREAAAVSEAADATENAGVPQINEAFPYLELEPAEDGSMGAGGDAHTTADVDAGGTGQSASEEAGVGGNVEERPGAAADGEAVDQADGADEAVNEAEARREAKAREREARGAIKQALDELMAEYVSDDSGIEIREIAGGYRMATKPQCHDAVRMFVKSLKPPLKLSLPALETLAVIAYKQPVTAPEVNEIRGVDSSGVFGSLLARKLIVTAGRKQVVGRPILYKTTREFLLRFGLKDVTELPSMEEFEKMAASEFEEETALAVEDETHATAEFDANLSAETEEAASSEPADAKENTPEAGPGGNE
jgi:segregation and condensation protein B